MNATVQDISQQGPIFLALNHVEVHPTCNKEQSFLKKERNLVKKMANV